MSSSACGGSFVPSDLHFKLNAIRNFSITKLSLIKTKCLFYLKNQTLKATLMLAVLQVVSQWFYLSIFHISLEDYVTISTFSPTWGCIM